MGDGLTGLVICEMPKYMRSKKYAKRKPVKAISFPRRAPRARELKFFDTSLAFTIDTTGEVPATGQLVLIPQGATESSRVGRSCLVTSLYIRGVAIFDPAAAADAATIGYIYVVVDTQCNGAAAAATDVLDSADFSIAMPNLNNSQRFRILKRITLVMNPGSGATGAYNTVVKPFQCYVKMSLPVEYSSTTGAIGEIRSNNLFLLAGATQSDDLISVTGQARVRYYDD